MRSALLTVGAWLVLLVATQVLLPGSGGGGRGTPGAVLFSGIVRGVLTALTAVGLVVVYRVTRIVNFAQTAIGAAGAELTFQLLQLTSTPWWVAILLGVAVAAAAGLVFDITIGRRFFLAPRLVLTTATIAVAALLSGLSRTVVNLLPFFPPRSERTLEQLTGSGLLRARLPFAHWSFTIGDVRIPFGFVDLFAIGVGVAAIAGVAAFFRFTASGTALRAMAENVERTALLGMSTGRLSSMIWVLTGSLSGIGLILTGVLTAPAAATGTAPQVLLPALAAAVLARMSSIPAAAGAAIGIEIARAAFGWSFQQDLPVFDLLLFAVIAGGLLLQRPLLARSEGGAGVSWEATQEQRPVPRELRSVPGIRITRWVLTAIGVVFLVVYPHVVGVGSVLLGGVIATTAIIALSVLVLTGWAGQVSLGQYGFAAVGGVVGGALTGGIGIPFWFAAPITAAITAGFAALIGIPALRIRGLFLAVSTFAFAIAVHSMLFSDRYFGWLLPDKIDRPTLLVLDFRDETSMYYLCTGALLACIVLVGNLRRSRTGRMLIAARENEANLQTFAMSAFRAKLIAFAVSGALAGFGGFLLVHLLRGTAAGSFAPQRSIDVFLVAVLGGVSSIPGVVIATILVEAKGYFLSGNAYFASIEPFFIILLLFIEPAGLIGLLNRMRDAVLRIVAQRRRLIVPSLFADRDPADLVAQLIPLAPPQPNSGLEVLDVDERFVLPTDLYLGSKLRLFSKAKTSTTSREAAVIGLAIGSVEDES
jgi:branched-chain amino acid transport system permease protein